MDDDGASLHCCSTLYLDVTLEEVNRGFDRLVSGACADEQLAQEITRQFRSRFRDLVYGNVVVDERGPTGSLTLEELLEQKLREVAQLRSTIPAEVRKKHEHALAKVYGRCSNDERTDAKS